MHVSEAFEATRELDEVLDRVEGGKEVVITRRGKAVARLLPLRLNFDPKKSKAAVDAIRKMSIGATLEGIHLKDLVNEGRR